MQKISIFVVLSCISCGAFGSVRLPVVDTNSRAVSARYAFTGEKPVEQEKSSVSKKVTERVAKNVKPVDYLQPKKPTSNLWANVDTNLRMPMADEFRMITSNDLLPEEHIQTEIASADLDNVPLLPTRKSVKQIANAHVDEPVQIVSQNIDSTVVENDEPVKISRRIIKSKPNTIRSINMSDSDDMFKPRDKQTEEMLAMSPSELRRAFKKTYLSENKHLSTYPVESNFDELEEPKIQDSGFSAKADLSEVGSGIRTLEVKLKYRDEDSALSKDNYDLITKYASIVVNNPRRAVQISIPQSATKTKDMRKLTARRLALIEQILRDTGIATNRIMPVLTNRSSDGIILRVINNEQYEILSQQTNNEQESKKFKSLSW